MKTTTSEVRCDGCGKSMPVLEQRTAIFVTLRGQTVGHKKADCCSAQCFRDWASRVKLPGMARGPDS